MTGPQQQRHAQEEDGCATTTIATATPLVPSQRRRRRRRRRVLLVVVVLPVMVALVTTALVTSLHLQANDNDNDAALLPQTLFSGQRIQMIPPLTQGNSVERRGPTTATASTTTPTTPTTSPTTTTTTTTTTPFCYAYLLAGCDDDDPTSSSSSYRGFLYTIIVNIRILRERGSHQDVVVLVRMAWNATASKLTDQEEQWLLQASTGNGSGGTVRLVYLPQPAVATDDDFMARQYLKFDILRLTEYQRILYMDADVMPLCNLDYILNMSLSGVIQPNVVLAWIKEPANGGFFVLKPEPGDYEHIQTLIAWRKSTRDNFDKWQGWGHTIQTPDRWMAFQKKYVGMKWNFYAADGDQGLLYHWTKYVKQSVTTVYGVNADNWVRQNNDTTNHTTSTQQPRVVLVREKTFQPFVNQSCLPPPPPPPPSHNNKLRRKSRRPFHWGYALHPSYGYNLQNKPPYSDFIHFYGPFKPWENATAQPPPDCGHKKDPRLVATSARHYYFCQLRRLNRELQLGIDFDYWKDFVERELRPPPLELRRAPRRRNNKKKP